MSKRKNTLIPVKLLRNKTFLTYEIIQLSIKDDYDFC